MFNRNLDHSKHEKSISIFLVLKSFLGITPGNTSIILRPITISDHQIKQLCIFDLRTIHALGNVELLLTILAVFAVWIHLQISLQLNEVSMLYLCQQLFSRPEFMPCMCYRLLELKVLLSHFVSLCFRHLLLSYEKP